MNDTTHCMNCGKSHTEESEHGRAIEMLAELRAVSERRARTIQKQREKIAELELALQAKVANPVSSEALAIEKTINKRLNNENLELKRLAATWESVWREYMQHITKRGDHDAADTLTAAANKIVAKHAEHAKLTVRQDPELTKVEAA